MKSQWGYKIYCIQLKSPVWIASECNVCHSIPNGHKIMGQFPNRVEISGHSSNGDNFLANFPTGVGAQPDLSHKTFLTPILFASLFASMRDCKASDIIQ